MVYLIKIGKLGMACEANARLYRKGRQVLGSNSGGMVTKLLKLNSNKKMAVFQILEIAARTTNPKEYVGAILRGKTKAVPKPKWAKRIEQINKLLASLHPTNIIEPVEDG